MENLKLQNIIFDLGNVLLDLDLKGCKEKFEVLAKQEIDFKKLFHEKQNAFIDYELGLIEEGAFLQAIVKMIGQDTSIEAVRTAWNSMLGNLPLYRLNMLEKLRRQYRLFLLSNTNAMHFDWLEQQVLLPQGWSLNDFKDLFEKTYLSYKIHLRKPDPAIYQYVLENANIEASHSLFIDDNPHNIAAAKRVGLQTLLHLPQQEITEVLAEKGLHVNV